MQKNIVDLQNTLTAEIKTREAAETQAQTAKKYADGILHGLLRFAYKDYTQNVYLDGTSDFDGFLQAFEITLSEEDKAKI